MSEAPKRRPGRPAISPEQRPLTVHVKVSVDLYDRLCRTSVRTGRPVNAIVLAILRQAEASGVLK